MAGVETDADTAFVFHPVDDVGQVLEGVTQGGALAGGVFDHCGDAAGFIQSDVDGLGDAVQALLLADFAQVGTGVKIEQRQPQLGAALQLIDKGIARFLQPGLFRVAQVDEVAVVGQDVFGSDARRLQVRLERRDAFGCQWLGHPLALILGKEGKGLRPDGLGVKRGVLHATGRADMSTDSFH